MSLIEIVLLGALAIAGLVAWRLRAELREARLRHARDLEEQREQRGSEMRAEAARTTALFDRMVEGVILVEEAGRIRLANRAAGELFGFAPPAANRTVLEATGDHEVAALVTRLDREPEVLNHDLRVEAGGGTRYVQVNALALGSREGMRTGGILVFHDVTRLRQLEAVRQEFVANVSHELRTPLSLIKSAAETLIDGGKDDPAVTARFLEIIDKHAVRLAHLIDDLLLMARLDSGRVELHLEPVALRLAAQEALDDAALLARARGARLTNQVPADLSVFADRERLRQVLGNLIDNAIKYGRKNGEVTVTAKSAGADRVQFGVRDDGPGIPPEALSRVFERFYRVDKARSREQGGTGLGLAIVKNVVQAHGGDVRVESVPGHGAEFFITLPNGDGRRETGDRE